MKDKNSYLIEDLPGIFANQAEEAETNHERMVKEYEENFPESDPPEWLKSNFNIARALSVMAAEIDRLKTICN